MPRVEESHKGHEIIIEEPDLTDHAGEPRLFSGRRRLNQVNEPRVYIDGRPMTIIKRADGTYSSEGVFYQSYPSLSELAKASIDAHLSDE
jgi:hypothetical protein